MLTASGVIAIRARSRLLWIAVAALSAFACTGAAEFVDASSSAKVRAPEPAPAASTAPFGAGASSLSH